MCDVGRGMSHFMSGTRSLHPLSPIARPGIMYVAGKKRVAPMMSGKSFDIRIYVRRYGGGQAGRQANRMEYAIELSSYIASVTVQ